MKRARKLLRAGEITRSDLVLLDCLAWSCRAPDAGEICVSYSRLMKLCAAARSTIAASLRRLQAVGLISKVKRRTLVLWHQGGRAWRQLPNLYRLLARNASDHCEFTERTDSRTQVIQKEAANKDVAAAQAALARRRREIEARLAGKGSGITELCGR